MMRRSEIEMMRKSEVDMNESKENAFEVMMKKRSRMMRNKPGINKRKSDQIIKPRLGKTFGARGQIKRNGIGTNTAQLDIRNIASLNSTVMGIKKYFVELNPDSEPSRN